MPKRLYLIDLSPFMYAGSVNKYSFFEQLIDVGTTWKTQRTPAGGISFLLNTIRDIANKGDVVFCTDREPTIKKDMYANYKYNRSHNHNVIVERGVAEYILQECDCNIFARAGYEADDLIYTFVKKCYNSYDEIYVYTGDSDMFFLVDDKVSILPASSKGKTVTRSNFEQTKIHGSCYRYNTLTYEKILHGDTSDNIPALPRSVQAKMNAVFGTNLEIKKCLGDKDFLLYYAQNCFPEAIDQINLVFPLFVDDLPTEFQQMNWPMLCCFGNAMHNRNFANYRRDDFNIDGYVAEMQSRGLYLEEVN